MKNDYLTYATEAGKFLLRLVPVAGEIMHYRTNRKMIIIDSAMRISGIGFTAAGFLTSAPVAAASGIAMYAIPTMQGEYHYIKSRTAKRQ